MSDISRDQVEAALSEIQDRYAEQDLISSKAVKDITIKDGNVNIAITLGYPAGPYMQELASEVETKVTALGGVNSAKADVSFDVISHAVQKSLKPLQGIKNIIAVASGKGGVGKSTTSVNLALALAADGAKVGILDADIYGPSQPRMLGVSGQPESKDGQSLEPMESLGLKAMSIGFLVEEDTAMIWRGPMVTQALEQLLNNTNWGALDYLIVDMPPGTGDTQLTLSQKIPVSGAVIVTTPQDIALLDARRGLRMFEKVEVPVLGVVENMSMHICSQCGHKEHIFGDGGGVRMAEEHKVDYLGGLPLDITIREKTDSGNPTVASDPEGEISSMYRDISRKMAAQLALTAKDYSAKFPNIVIQNV